MRENLTDSFRKMLDQAQAEARSLKQEFVTAEHLLLAILHRPDCDAAKALAAVQVPFGPARSALLRTLPQSSDEPGITGNLPLSPKTLRAVNSAIVRAQSLREPSVSTRLLLLSLLDEPQTALRQTLRECGADLDQLQRKLAERPDHPEP